MWESFRFGINTTQYLGFEIRKLANVKLMYFQAKMTKYEHMYKDHSISFIIKKKRLINMDGNAKLLHYPENILHL